MREGIAEVTLGRTFCLSLPLDYPGGSKLVPRRHPPRLEAVDRHGRPGYNYAVEQEDLGATDVISDESVRLFTQYSSHWDSLAHAGSLFDADGDGTPEKVYYNGFRADEHIQGPPTSGNETAFSPVRAAALGIEHVAASCVQGRGVLIELHAHFGDAHQAIGYDRLMRVLEADRVVVEPGDMFCLHTGFALHEFCLFKLGIHLAELWYSSEQAGWLRRHERSRFLLTAPPLRLPCAVGSPVTPVATV